MHEVRFLFCPQARYRCSCSCDWGEGDTHHACIWPQGGRKAKFRYSCPQFVGGYEGGLDTRVFVIKLMAGELARLVFVFKIRMEVDVLENNMGVMCVLKNTRGEEEWIKDFLFLSLTLKWE